MLILLILLSLTVLVISFLCSLTEAVLLSLNPLDLKLQEKKGIRSAGRWLVMKQSIERPISAILVFNTLANTGMATLAGAVFTGIYGPEWLWVFSILMCVLVLFGGEMAPKIIGVHHAAGLAPRLIGPLSFMLWVCHPLVLLMVKFCERLKRGTADGRSQSDQIMDIITLVQAAKAEQLLHNQEEIIMIHAATLSARRVKTAMVPKDAVNVFDVRRTLLENVEAAGPKLHRSYPVSLDGTRESIIGYVRVRELFVQNLAAPATADWTKLVRPALRIDGKASLTQLLALFLDKQEVAALVESPGGLIAGWITMDDVMKVLMGARI
ncbi:CBS domain containing-hemolysin-like protein [Prosthecobacter fusiformis]|uniref:CBS domain containing-hemolysin-like protein n=1 Tax=Prosthecobacter fusiformis TaxID=48464 RepID=A0A4R7RUA7_9BACT|nr:CNNM domain-containing protein [Prosthecobacter fusiformis]TDU68017.1 CBS domain containing-hemolysin-like protein [Prosthecobacter fusiformis]